MITSTPQLCVGSAPDSAHSVILPYPVPLCRAVGLKEADLKAWHLGGDGKEGKMRGSLGGSVVDVAAAGDLTMR